MTRRAGDSDTIIQQVASSSFVILLPCWRAVQLVVGHEPGDLGPPVAYSSGPNLWPGGDVSARDRKLAHLRPNEARLDRGQQDVLQPELLSIGQE